VGGATPGRISPFRFIEERETMKKTGYLLGVAFLLLLCTSAHAQGPDAIVGKWLDGEQKAQVDIYKAAGKYFGKIVWLKEPTYPADDKKGMAGKQKVDRENPDPVRRNQPVLGLVILRNFVFANGNLWQQGQVYDPKNGKDYKCKLTLKSLDALDVRGYIGFSFIGRTDRWTRVR
jgi:uncharacterized protein (DUF2147 family)